MTELAARSLCSGCAACRAACPKGAISMKADAEGFLYPLIDETACVSCGKCRRVCPVLNRPQPREPQAVYAALAKDTALRLASSSGGLFSLLARPILARGGVVFGAAWDYTSHTVKIVSVRTEAELAALRGSKYVQADVGDAYEQTCAALQKDIPVLYSGTPCQIVALNRVLGKSYANLLTVEIICHAAPSPLAFQKYAAQRERRAGSKISRIFSRSKNCSWKRYAMSLSFHAKGIAYLKPLTEDTFLRGFLAELYNRPSCHACSVRELRSGADITLADYWNVHRKFPVMDDDRGTSVVLVNTEKGAEAFAAIQPDCRVAVSDYADIRRTNPAVYRSSSPHPKRGRFFAQIPKTDDFDALVMRLCRPTLKARIRRFGGRILRKLGIRRTVA